MTEKTKKNSFIEGLKNPNSYVIILSLILVCMILTWIVPSGSYERVQDPASGRTVIDPQSFHYVEDMDYSRKEQLNFISIIRLPDFVNEKDFEWAVKEATRKKKMDFSKVEFLVYEEGICVQCMHLGPYDDEPKTVKLMDDYAKEKGYANDITDKRYHHEIYLSDPRKCEPHNLKTVIRHPVKKI